MKDTSPYIHVVYLVTSKGQWLSLSLWVSFQTTTKTTIIPGFASIIPVVLLHHREWSPSCTIKYSDASYTSIIKWYNGSLVSFFHPPAQIQLSMQKIPFPKNFRHRKRPLITSKFTSTLIHFKETVASFTVLKQWGYKYWSSKWKWLMKKTEAQSAENKTNP